MDTSQPEPRSRVRIGALLAVLAAVLIGSVALSPAPASAASLHTLRFTASVDIKDDDAGDDDWCRERPLSAAASLNHDSGRFRAASNYVTCDEVTIEVRVAGELMANESICNLRLDIYLYEGWSGDDPRYDLDGHRTWSVGPEPCLAPGGTWQPFGSGSVQMDNTEEPRSNDHGWVRGLTITHPGRHVVVPAPR